MNSARKITILLVFMFLLVLPPVLANGLSISLKRTNPGIVGIKPAEMIFDIVNTDTDYKLNGFVLCKSPDDVQVSSTLGLGSGSGAQYISPMFELDTAPSQKAVYFTIEASSEGDYATNCIFKYIPYREENGEKIYLKMNLEETTELKDSNYREIRLDKTVPFLELSQDYVNAYCPKGKSECKASEVILVKPATNNILLYLSIVLAVGIFILLVILKRSKN
jgi:hypothetical protein